MYKKSITHYISKVIVDILFVLSIICTLAVPFVTRFLVAIPMEYRMTYEQSQYVIALIIILFLSGICGSYILFNLKQMYTSLLVGDPFVDKNVSHFRKMAVACAIIALIYTIKCFIMFTYATVIIALAFSIACLFCLTLKDLFKQAINYKTENELTI